MEQSEGNPRRRTLPRPFSFHWGGGQVVEEASCTGEYHEPTIQLLEYEDGSVSIRFCSFNHMGQFQRSPLLISEQDLAPLRASLENCPRLSAFLKGLLLPS